MGGWLGNDYDFTAILQPLLYRFYEYQGIEPVWYPHVSGGVPIGTYFFAQPYHLPSFLLSRLAWYGDGGLKILFALKHIFYLSVLHFMAWSRFDRVLPKSPWAFLLAAVLIFNLRILDAVRYGIYIDTLFYMTLMICAAIEVLRCPSWWKTSALAFFVYLFLTSGYTALFPFLILFAVVYLPRLLFAHKINARGLGAFSGACGVGCLLSVPLWILIADFISTNQTRVENSRFEWANYHPMNLEMWVQNLFRPWLAEVHSAFGGSSVIALAAFLILTCFYKSWFRPLRPAVLYSFFLFLFAAGGFTPLYPLLFRYFPMINSVRGPGRILVFFVPLIFIELEIFSRSGIVQQCVSGLKTAFFNKRLLWTVTLLTVAGLLLWLVGGKLGHSENDDFLPVKLRGEWSFAASLWTLGGLAILSAMLRARSLSPRVYWAAIFCGFFLQLTPVMSFGSWFGPLVTRETYVKLSTQEHFPLITNLDLSVPGIDEGNAGVSLPSMSSYVVSHGTAGGCLLPFDRKGTKFQSALKIGFYLIPDQEYPEFYTPQQEVDCGLVFKELQMTPDVLQNMNRANRVLCLTPNKVCLWVTTPLDSVLITGFPFLSNRWHVTIDGVPGRVSPYFHGILGFPVPAGSHILKVEYQNPWMGLGAYFFGIGSVLLWVSSLLGFAVIRTSRAYIFVVLLSSVLPFSVSYNFVKSAEIKTHAEVLLPTNYSQRLEPLFEDLGI